MDRAVDAAAAEQRAVGGIDDGVDIEPGDVADDDLDAIPDGHRGEFHAACSENRICEVSAGHSRLPWPEATRTTPRTMLRNAVS